MSQPRARAIAKQDPGPLTKIQLVVGNDSMIHAGPFLPGLQGWLIVGVAAELVGSVSLGFWSGAGCAIKLPRDCAGARSPERRCRTLHSLTQVVLRHSGSLHWLRCWPHGLLQER